jgi:hypothetical protein
MVILLVRVKFLAFLPRKVEEWTLWMWICNSGRNARSATGIGRAMTWQWQRSVLDKCVVAKLSKHKVFELCGFTDHRFSYEDIVAKVLHLVSSGLDHRLCVNQPPSSGVCFFQTQQDTHTDNSPRRSRTGTGLLSKGVFVLHTRTHAARGFPLGFSRQITPFRLVFHTVKHPDTTGAQPGHAQGLTQ